VNIPESVLSAYAQEADASRQSSRADNKRLAAYYSVLAKQTREVPREQEHGDDDTTDAQKVCDLATGERK
jgi:hypothetical protein